jgi:hypothetical protein
MILGFMDLAWMRALAATHLRQVIFEAIAGPPGHDSPQQIQADAWRRTPSIFLILNLYSLIFNLFISLIFIFIWRFRLFSGRRSQI